MYTLRCALAASVAVVDPQQLAPIAPVFGGWPLLDDQLPSALLDKQPPAAEGRGPGLRPGPPAIEPPNDRSGPCSVRRTWWRRALRAVGWWLLGRAIRRAKGGQP
jgi:hypothetical protein